tara:strand:+ start:829 stop:1047 length:219 start_codon:yes stop_codon:yes gene_type:complete
VTLANLSLVTLNQSNDIGGISMPIGFVETEEKDKDEIWIQDLIQHFFSCLDEDCTRCAYAVENNFLEFLKTR